MSTAINLKREAFIMLLSQGNSKQYVDKMGAWRKRCSK